MANWSVAVPLFIIILFGMLLASKIFRSNRAVLLVSLMIQLFIVGPLSPPDGGRWTFYLLIVFGIWNVLLWIIYKFLYGKIEGANTYSRRFRFIILAMPILLTIGYGLFI